MEKSPLVSVIIPVYNQESYVEKCLKSIVNQTYRNLQIIVVNDGSTDNSLIILNKYKEKDDRIVVLTKKNEGVALARKEGLQLAKGDFVTFVDSDDFLPNSAISELMEPARQYMVDVVIGSLCRYFGWGIKKELHQSSQLSVNRPILREELFDKYFISFFGINILPVNMCGGLYRKSVVDLAMQKEKLFDKNCLHMGEDEYFSLMLFPFLHSLYVIDKIVYYYRFGGITSSYNKYLAECFYLGDVRVKILDKYCYAKGYAPLYVEYKNILYSELLQRIQYKHQTKKELMDYIKREINSRYLVSRMVDYYMDKHCPEYMIPIVTKDCESIYLHAKSLAKANKWRFMLKQILARISNVL